MFLVCLYFEKKFLSLILLMILFRFFNIIIFSLLWNKIMLWSLFNIWMQYSVSKALCPLLQRGPKSCGIPSCNPGLCTNVSLWPKSDLGIPGPLFRLTRLYDSVFSDNLMKMFEVTVQRHFRKWANPLVSCLGIYLILYKCVISFVCFPGNRQPCHNASQKTFYIFKDTVKNHSWHS